MEARLSRLMAVGLLVLLILTFWLLLACVVASAGPEGTIVGGTITTDTTWTPAGSPYILQNQNVTVADNVRLTIEPGVTVEFNAGRSLWVYGTLLAAGMPTQPITFTRMAGGTQPWGTIQIGGGTVLTDSNASQISYATIEGGGSSPQMLYVYQSAPTLDHLTLCNSNTRGLYATNVPAGSTLSWDTGTVTGNGGEGVYVYSGRVVLSNLNIANNGTDGVEFSSAHDSQLLNSSVQDNGGNGIHTASDRLLLQGLTLSGNTGYGIYMQTAGADSILRDTTVQGNAVAARLHPDTLLDNVTWTGNTRSEIEWITGRIKSSRAWARLPEINTYRVLGHVTLEDNTTLTVDPGVTVGVQAGTNLWLGGTLSAVGTPTQPITFTRMAGATQPWGYLQIGGGSVVTDSDVSRVSYATIEGGGSAGQMLYVYRSGPTLDHLTLRNSSTKGLYVGNVSTDSSVSWDTGTVTGNTGEGVYVAAGRVALSNLTIASNGGDGVELNSAHDSQLLNSSVQGNGGNGIHTNSDRLLLEGLTVSGNTGYGIYMQAAGADSILRDTTVQGNGVAARLHPDILLENVTWTGNLRSEIEWIYGRINSSRTWARLPEINTYRVLGNVTAPDNTLLSVEPGVTVQLDPSVSLDCMGGFWAVGTPSQPITFTRAPGATQPWGMIEIGGGNVQGDSDASRVSYATIEGGGSEGKLVHIYYSSASMDHVTVRNSSSIGIQVSPIAGTQVTLDTVAVTNNAGIAVRHITPGPSLSYRNLTLQGNGTDVVSIGSGSIRSPYQWDLKDAGAPVRTGSLYVDGGGMLALMPGTRLEFASAAGLEVWSGSGLYALGTAEAPVTLTGVLSQPGAWKGVWLKSGSRAILRNCNVEYGGAAAEPALKMQSSESAVIYNSGVRHAAGDGVLVDDATPPVLRQNDISGNAFGVRNNRPAVPVDARQVWWGDPSGPYHPTLNPDGLGNAVSDGVLFEPWLTSVPTGTVPISGLILQVVGPRNASPGQSVIYGAVYVNETGQEIQDAVLLLALPQGASFEEAFPASSGEGRGIYWPERYQAFWRLGTLPPGAQGTVAVRVRYFWGLNGTDTILGLIGGSNWGPTRFDLASYLAYQPLELHSRTALTPADVAAERQAYPVLDDFFVQGEADGFVYTSAAGYAYQGGTSRVVIRLDRPDRTASMEIVRQGQIVQAYLVDGNSFTLRTVLGDMIYDRATDAISFTGGLAGEAGGLAPGAAASSPQAEPTKEACTRNCLYLNSDPTAFDTIRRWFSGGSMVSPDNEVGQKCERECENDPSWWYCQQDIRTCDGHRPLSFFRPAPEHIVWSKCNQDTGLFEPGGTPDTPCSVKPIIEKCTFDDNANPVCEGCTQEEECGKASTIIYAPMDPNAKYGPAGDLLPGDVVSYTVTYENVGEGIAYGVFVEDRLSEHFNENTLEIGHSGLYMPTSRTLLWDIGELGPKDSPTASGSVTFTAQLGTGLPGGTPIINQAVVYFPSAPEETPTNQVVNLIWPVVGVPQTVEVQAGHSVPITLAGRDPGQSPLTFQVVEPPGRGALSGSAPELTYAAPFGFAGQDLFTFKASNAVTDSRPAEVTVLVVPDPADTTPPTLAWTVPQNNAVVPISASPAFTDSIGPVYTPYIFARFGETIDASTVTTATLLLAGPDGTAIPVTVFYSDMTGEAMALLRQPLQPATTYTVRATQGIKDLAGNPLAADFEWTFRTAGGENAYIYLPLVMRTP